MRTSRSREAIDRAGVLRFDRQAVEFADRRLDASLVAVELSAVALNRLAEQRIRPPRVSGLCQPIVRALRKNEFSLRVGPQDLVALGGDDRQGGMSKCQERGSCDARDRTDELAEPPGTWRRGLALPTSGTWQDAVRLDRQVGSVQLTNLPFEAGVAPGLQVPGGLH